MLQLCLLALLRAQSFHATQQSHTISSTPPPSLPPTIPDFTCAPFFTSIIVAYTVADDVGIQHAYVELLKKNYTLIELKQAEDNLPGAIKFSGVIEFLNLTPGSSFIVKVTTFDTNGNMTSREEHVQIADMTAPVINEFTTIYHVRGHNTVDVNVSDDSGGSVVCIAYLYWIFDFNYAKLDSYWVELTDGAGSVTFTDLDL